MPNNYSIIINVKKGLKLSQVRDFEKCFRLSDFRTPTKLKEYCSGCIHGVFTCYFWNFSMSAACHGISCTDISYSHIPQFSVDHRRKIPTLTLIRRNYCISPWNQVLYFDYFVSSVKTNEVNTVGRRETFRFTHVGDEA